MISTRSMKSLGIVDRLTRLPIAELDTVRRPSISTRVRLSPRLRSWIDDRPEFWVLPVTVESLSVDESCGRSASVSLSSLFPDSSRSSLVMLTVGAAVSYVSRAMRLRSEEHTSELQSLMRIPYAAFCLKKKIKTYTQMLSDSANQIR